jgi:osmoprotectant transport system ATP-binding protein
MFLFHAVHKKFESNFQIDLDLKIPTQKTTVIVGPSGCGKSTLLRLLNCLIQPDSGEILFHQQPLKSIPVNELRKKMAIVIQGGGLFPHMTARKNVVLMAELNNWSEAKIEARLNELIQLTHFPKDALNRLPVHLSGGQKQRLSLMRALMLDPESLLMDEPLGALDPIIRRELQEELRPLFRILKKTVVMVTHDLAEAHFFADQIVLMRDGSVIQVGELKDFVQRPANAFVTQFVHAQRSVWEER